ncbi:MAG: (Fe-S)-binding protein [Candidatus Thorarchaeota archaeon]
MTEKNIEFLKGKGITKITTVPNQKDLKNYQNLDYYRDIYYQCGKCGTCRTAYQEDYWSKICPSGEFGKFEAFYLGGKNLLSWGLVEGKLKWTENLAKIFYQCSVCQACMQQCQIPEIHHYAGEWLMAMREEAVKQGFGPMPEQKRYSEHIANEFNPYMEKHEDRLNWMPSHIINSSDSKIAYFVGCTSSYREKEIAIATAEILNSLGIKFRVFKEEHCCGSPVYMTGQFNEAQKIAESNIKIFKNAGIERIITSCAGCYRMLKETYPNKFGLEHEFEVLHLPEYLLNKLNNNELNFTNELNMKITYHDPCHLGRHMGVYEPPRELLKKIPGIELVEMVRNRYNAWCCGSGGGVRSAFKGLSEFAANERIKEAKETQAEAIVSACPFCANQFKTNISDSFQVFDIAELVKKAL